MPRNKRTAIIPTKYRPASNGERREPIARIDRRPLPAATINRRTLQRRKNAHSGQVQFCDAQDQRPPANPQGNGHAYGCTRIATTASHVRVRR